MHSQRRGRIGHWLVTGALAGAALSAQAGTTMKVNELTVFRDGGIADWTSGQNVLLRDSFDNGNPLVGPSFTGGDAAGYTLLDASNPATVLESGGQLLMNAGLADLSTGAAGGVGHSTRVRLLTNLTDPNRGLPQSRSFGVAADLSLEALPDVGAQFGLRLSDGFSNNNDVIELSLVHRAAGYGVQFRKQDFLTHTITDIDFASLSVPASASGLVLALLHPVAGTNVIGAAYGYLDGNGELVGNLNAFNNYATAFNGEVHTRVELRATAPVPEPSTWALMALGVAALGTARLKRRA